MNATATEHSTTAPTRWALDPTDSTVEFTVKTFWGLGTVHGRFDRFDGRFDDAADESAIELAIEADSLDTGHGKRDEHLRADAFFHVEEHPRIRFRSTRVSQVYGEILHVGGHLEAAGTSVWVEFPATVRPVADGLEIEATTTVDQRELGMSSGPLGMIRSPATLHVKARLTR